MQTCSTQSRGKGIDHGWWGRPCLLLRRSEVLLTFIFSNVLEGKREACIFPLDDSNLSKGSFANNAEETEVVEVHCERRAESVGGRHRQRERGDVTYLRP